MFFPIMQNSFSGRLKLRTALLLGQPRQGFSTRAK
jgi:hypothetical protein